MPYRMMLAVNFTPERLEQVKLLALLTKSKVKAVTDEEKGETVGKVLGLTDEEIAEISAMRQDTEEARVHEKMNEDEICRRLRKKPSFFVVSTIKLSICS